MNCSQRSSRTSATSRETASCTITGYHRAEDKRMRWNKLSDELLAKVVEDLGYFQRDGIMYHHWIPQGRGQEDAMEQVVLPKQCRRAVLELANTIPLGDHLRNKKTAVKIRRRFYWQTLFCDMADFCRSCDQCQKAGHQ